MEGYLKKYVNVVQRWQQRYFILNDEILLYCDTKSGSTKGQIHLKVSSIIMVLEDPLRFIINTGTTEIHLRASTVAEKINWVNALKTAQEKCLQSQSVYGDQQNQSPSSIQVIQDNLADIWVIQAQFDETMSLLTPKLERNSQIRELATKVESLGRALKNKVTLCTQMLEDEKRKVLSMIQGDSIINQGNYDASNEFQNSNGNHYQSMQEENRCDTVFQSFAELDSQRLLNGGIEQNRFNFEQNEYKVTDIIQQLRYTQPIKYKNIIDNPVFKQLKVGNATQRDRLLKEKDPKEKLNIFALIKDLIGKDLTKFSVPVFLNEPLSMLQRLSEQLQHYKLFEQGNKQQDSCLRMCYIGAFVTASYVINLHRLKKPFNPLLGESYEQTHPHYNFISEQVSHHPPISAGFADGLDFQMWGHTALKSKFTGRSMEIQPLGSQHIILKHHNDHFTYKKPVTYIKNILLGEIYMENVGEISMINHTTQDTGVLKLSERGWNNKGLYEISGSIRDAQGIERYRFKGRYDQQVIAIDVQTNQEILIWSRTPSIDENPKFYNFTFDTLQLNHLNDDLLKSIACNDSRLRPDQMALEMGLYELASSEKNRLEEKQRAKRKQQQLRNEEYIPRYFVQKIDTLTQETQYEYLQNYWDLKSRNQEALDIF